MHGYHVIGDVFVTLLASALLMAVAVVICELGGRRTPKPPRVPLRFRRRGFVFSRDPEVPADGEPLSEEEMSVFADYVIAEKRKGIARSDAE